MIHLIVKNREGIVFESDVDTISSSNKKGTFDILTYHENFITLLETKLFVRKDGQTKTIEVNNGMAKVSENTVHVYLGVKNS